MTDQDAYRPRSPDFSSFQSRLPQSNPSPYTLTSPLAHRASYDASPFFAPQYHPGQRLPQQYVPPGHEPSFDSDMARRSSRIAQTADVAPIPDTEDIKPEMPEEQEPEKPSIGAGVDVKTKFPVARIKRIMQADEDVGKVAQVTPIAVCRYSPRFDIQTELTVTAKALELFMISLVSKASQEAKDRNSKRITASHLKHAVSKDEVLDFLADIIAKVPDQAPGRKHDDDGSDHQEGRRKRGGRRPKEESE